jgi:hypothetical protein
MTVAGLGDIAFAVLSTMLIYERRTFVGRESRSGITMDEFQEIYSQQ